MPRSTLALTCILGLWAGLSQASPLGDPEAGKEVFKSCKGCHQVGEGAKNGVGPHLNFVFGRRAAGLEGYRYSKSLERAGVSGVEWHADTLDAYIEDPRGFASGTRMSFRGLKDPQDRANLIAYLRLYSDNPANIPEADPTARLSEYTVDAALLAIDGDREYGQYLSGECKACHLSEGADGIPPIVYWPEDDFKVALYAYKSGQRLHPVMQMIASRLGDEEIAALAAYFENPD